nr:hypothetical protein [Sphingomonas melonis]
MQAFFATVTAALITGLIGNWLVQRWQLRNWFAQQRHEFNQQELDQLTKLFDEISTLSSSRLNAMRSLLNSMHINADYESDVLAYKAEILKWNTSLHLWFARITFLISWSMTTNLENGLHAAFVRNGTGLEVLIRHIRAHGSISSGQFKGQDRSLNALAGEVDRYLKLILSQIQDRRALIKSGKRLKYNEADLAEYTTFDLVKTLFTSDVDGIDIIRPA